MLAFDASPSKASIMRSLVRATHSFKAAHISWNPFGDKDVCLCLWQSELQGFQQQVSTATTRNLSKTAMLSSYIPYKAPVRTNSCRRCTTAEC